MDVSKQLVPPCSCEAFNKFIKDPGVTDAEKSTNPGWAAATTFQVQPSSTYETDSPRHVNLLYCGINNRYFLDVNECLKNCKVSLGTTGKIICGPGGKGLALKTIKFDVQFKLFTQTVRLEWQPERAPDQACLDEKSAWEKEAEAHEQRHIDDALDIVRATEKSRKDKTYEGYGQTVEGAKMDLEARIKKDLEDEAQKLKQQIKEAEKKRHDAEDLVRPLNCSVCG
jgi:hypothetical protein